MVCLLAVVRLAKMRALPSRQSRAAENLANTLGGGRTVGRGLEILILPFSASGELDRRAVPGSHAGRCPACRSKENASARENGPPHDLAWILLRERRSLRFGPVGLGADARLLCVHDVTSVSTCLTPPRVPALCPTRPSVRDRGDGTAGQDWAFVPGLVPVGHKSFQRLNPLAVPAFVPRDKRDKTPIFLSR